ncbi:hypothetical protein PR001_g14776 [Phytophthora rubi]|uniref:HAT C-terminal dimerisation domain-containing protein n=1 Tax=Phytophthora rubi TaxID=129364 RepID=A0A6A3LDJ5_9STRA|nr:hypothetical protein PR001_g14776 [Phytophthora rubi]
MDSTVRNAVENVLEERHGKNTSDAVIEDLVAYFRHARELKTCQPRQWNLLCERKVPLFDFWCGLATFPLLQDVALQLFWCAASSAASERNFSAHAYIYSKLCNRLAPDRVEKLVHIFFNAKNICDEDIDRSSHLEDLLRECDEEETMDETEVGNRSEDYVYN